VWQTEDRVPTEEEFINEQALQELRATCEANNVAHVRHLYSRPPYDGVIDDCLEDSNPNIASLRCVLEDSARPNAVMLMPGRKLSSQDTLELLAEFGHGIQLRDYLILQ
jgi:hypothetical protein